MKAVIRTQYGSPEVFQLQECSHKYPKMIKLLTRQEQEFLKKAKSNFIS